MIRKCLTKVNITCAPLQTVCLAPMAVSAVSSATVDLVAVIEQQGFVMNLAVMTGGFLKHVPNKLVKHIILHL